MSVEGLDAVYIGPSDLSLSLGCRPVFDDLDPKAQQAVDHILERAKAHGLVAGIHNGTPEGALARIASTLPATARVGLETSGLFVPRRGPTAPPEPWLPVLRRAIREERKLALDYRDAGGQATRRIIWPFAMAFFDHARLIAAWCELRQDFRHFRADRVAHLAATDQPLPERRHVLIRRWRDTAYAGPP